MSDEPTQPIVNQSNLLQTPINNEQFINNNPSQSHSFDDMPIGGKKFQFSQFPEQGEVKVPVKKPFKPRTAKGAKKTQAVNNQLDITQTGQKKQQNGDNALKQNQNDNSTIGNKTNFDQMPIGGKKFDIPQFADEQPKQQKKPVKPRVNKVKKSVQEKKDQIPIDTQPNQNLNPVNNQTSVRKINFDQAPVGKSNFNMSEFPQGDQQPVQVQYTMSQKLKSKAVKMRVSGLQDLLQLIQSDPKNPDCTQVQLSKLLKQTNPACLQKVLLCFRSWVVKDMSWGDDEAKLAIESGYINGKANTKKLTVQICDLLYQRKPDVLQMTIKVGLKGKVAKSLAGYISIVNELLTIYGIKKMKYLKPYMGDIIVIMNRQKLMAVKTQGVNILKQAYKWMSKQVVDPLIKDLKQGLRKQLDSFWQGYDKQTIMKAPKDTQEQVGGLKKKVDAYQLSEAIDIFKKYNQKWSQSVLKQQKWNQKVQLMKDFVNTASVPKISLATQYRHIIEMVKRLINHSNFNVVLWDLKILAVLSKGIRRPFAHVVRSVFLNVIGKFRQKRTQMVDETFRTLNDFSYCISIQDVLDDVKEGLNDKVPNMKVNLINWIGKFVEGKIEQKNDLTDKTKQAIRNLFPIFQKLLGDSTLQVRNCMAKNLGKLKILLGDNFFTAMDNKMNKTMADKVNDAKSKTNVKKVSKQKDQKGNLNNSSSVKIQSGKGIQSTSKIKVDLSQQIFHLIPKMNHSDWQKRRDSAEQAIALLSQSQKKVHLSCLSDLLNTLKVRIADPNKQLIRTFVNLTAIVFGLMSQRQVKANAKNFLCGLADGLSDKMQSNRKQICNSLNKIGDIYGKQQLITILGAYLQGEKDSRIQIINLIIQNQQYIQKADTREFPKGLIKILCDRNKQIRNLGEKLLERVIDKMGIDIFRNLTRNQRPAIAKDLNSILDKYDLSKQGGIMNNSSLVSKGVSPPRHKAQPPISGKKNLSQQQKSLQKSIVNQKSFDRDYEQDRYSRGNINATILGRTIQTFVEGDDYFAPLKILSAERVQRQQKDERYPWLCDYVKQAQEDELTQSINGLIKQQIAKKMISLDYRKVLDAASQILKLCKQIAFQNQIRQLYDILMKWVFLRLWGGNPAIQSIIQILPPVMSILQKKKLALNDNQVDLIIAILRQYFLSAYMNQYQVSQSLYTIMKCLIVLSSGQRLLKKLLKQFNVQLSSIHRQVKREATIFYRDGLSRLVKSQLMEYIGNQDTLEEASQIKQLKNDSEFLGMLYKRFHQNVLKCFGFKSPEISSQPTIQPVVQQIQTPKQPVQQQTQPPQYQSRQSHTSKNKKPQNIRNPSNPSIKSSVQQQQPTQISNPNKGNKNTQLCHSDIDLSAYSIPHPASPLGKHLSKLIPPNDATVSFFNHLLNENGQKISNQLITHAKVIFGSILKSIIMMLDNRTQYPPQKIINQINLLQQALKCKNIVNNLGQLLNHGTKFTLTQLVIEDENKKMINEQLKSRGFEYLKQQNPFIKAINGVMLRILQNACPQQIVNILLGFLNANTSSSNPSQKNIYLIIKCLTRVVGNYATDINQRRTQELLYLLNQYLNITNLGFPLQQFNPVGQRLKPQQNVLKALKTILTQLARYYGQQIWTYHNNSIAQASFKDDYIPSFLEFMGIAYPQNIQTNKEDDHLKLINQLLSKTKTFDSGIQQIKKYMSLNPLFSPVQYFNSRGFDQRFIMMVMNSLQGRSVKRTPTKRQLRDQKSQNSRRGGEKSSDNTNIQQKIKKLKMRFQQVQPQTQQQPTKQQQAPVSTNSSSRAIQSEDKGQERAQEIKRRIDEMKNRMNNNGSRR